MEKLIHSIDPIYDSESETLLLGSFPSPLSRANGFPYGNPQNRFWAVVSHVFDSPFPATKQDRTDLILNNHLALWDVIRSCSIEGAADSTIQDVVANDIRPLIAASHISRIFTTGTAAQQLYKRHIEKLVGIQAVRLPSTSPANARMTLDQLIDAYQVIR